jgi:threonine dehydrogenase-like Zn-dependent dehydrogenase
MLPDRPVPKHGRPEFTSREEFQLHCARGDECLDRRAFSRPSRWAVLECVGTNEPMQQAINCARPSGSVGFVGVPRRVELSGEFLFFAQKSLMSGPAPVLRFLPRL